MDEPDASGSSALPGHASRGSVPRPHPSPWQLAGAGMQLLVALLAGVGIGAWLDRRFGMSPVGVLGGVVLAGGVFVRLVRPFLSNGGGRPGGSPRR
jgi:hypothetical protein